MAEGLLQLEDDIRILMPSRKVAPGVIDRSNFSDDERLNCNIHQNEIVRMRREREDGSRQYLYQGMDHSEAIPMLIDYSCRERVDGVQIALINADPHSDITSHIYKPDFVHLGSWIQNAVELGLVNRSIGPTWLYRKIHDDYPEDFYSREIRYNNTHLSVHMFDLDTIIGSPDPNKYSDSILDHIRKLKSFGMKIFTSVDFDTASLLGFEGPSYDADISKLDWFDEILRESDVVSTFNSEGFCPDRWAEYLEYEYRQKFDRGFAA